MKEIVTVEELNAATMLILGVSVDKLLEVHITSTAVSGVAVGDDGSLVALRVGIATDAVDTTQDPVDAEIVEDGT